MQFCTLILLLVTSRFKNSFTVFNVRMTAQIEKESELWYCGAMPKLFVFCITIRLVCYKLKLEIFFRT